ncbi:MAG: hypothetical protein ABI760_02270 [Ferruginibacter sp.]
MNSENPVAGFRITPDPSFEYDQFPNPPELRKQNEKLFAECQDGKNIGIIDRLNDLIVKYPQSPQLKNFLSVAYSVQGNFDLSQFTSFPVEVF